MRRWSLRFALALVLLLEGCLLDIAPRREPIDEVWKAHMLAGEYGQWHNGGKTLSLPERDKIESWPLAATRTRYGIDVGEMSRLSAGAWLMEGGLVARVVRPSAGVELFGKMTTRVHGPWYTATDRDMSCEFFLVVRSIATGRGRLIRQWTFPREDLTLSVPPKRAEQLRAWYSGAELEKQLAMNGELFVEGFLAFEERTSTATVTITGLVRPFQEHVDLSEELPR